MSEKFISMRGHDPRRQPVPYAPGRLVLVTAPESPVRFSWRRCTRLSSLHAVFALYGWATLDNGDVVHDVS
jgi:hypothetical protein